MDCQNTPYVTCQKCCSYTMGYQSLLLFAQMEALLKIVAEYISDFHFDMSCEVPDPGPRQGQVEKTAI